MRLPSDRYSRVLALGLTSLAAACAAHGGDGQQALASAADSVAASSRSGPAADYPMVLGEPYTVEGVEYVPADTASYDEVGYAALDGEGGAGITVAHKTLPLPSYVEITALDSGRTILARVERRGPMTGRRLVALSPGAEAQLGVGEGAPVRVRRVNPPEVERAELRAGRAAAQRMDTPKTLLGVLRRKLPANGSASLASAPPAPTPPAVIPTPVSPSVAPAAPATPRARNNEHPLRPLDAAPAAPATAGGDWVIQAAAFSSKDNAERAAGTLGGFVTPSGKFYRVRTGPYATRGQAEAALAKVRGAGYSDARVLSAG